MQFTYITRKVICTKISSKIIFFSNFTLTSAHISSLLTYLMNQIPFFTSKFIFLGVFIVIECSTKLFGLSFTITLFIFLPYVLLGLDDSDNTIKACSYPFSFPPLLHFSSRYTCHKLVNSASFKNISRYISLRMGKGKIDMN